MNKFFAWFGLPGTFVLTVLMSVLAVTLAVLRPGKHRFFCAAAMVISTLGDVFMTRFNNIDEIFPNYFTIGAVLFMIAHVMYCLCYRTLIKQKNYRVFNGGVIVALVIAAACVVYFSVICIQRQSLSIFPLAMIYLCAISSSCSMIYSYTWSEWKSRPVALLAAVGAISLFLSDLIIGLDAMAGVSRFNYLIWWLYPIGQILIILSAEPGKKKA